MPVLLPAQLIAIDGPDAVAFAQAQFSSDVPALANGCWHWSAWLNAQGRVRALFRLLRRADERLVLASCGGAPDAFAAALAPYVLRSRVRLSVPAQMVSVGFASAQEMRTALDLDPRDGEIVERGGLLAIALPGPTRRGLVLGAEAGLGADAGAAARNDWRAAEIAAGIAEITAATQARWLPDGLGLHELGAVSLRKGCYPGQEVVARLHYRGGNKRWLHRLAFRAAELPEPGLTLEAAGGGGEIVSAAWTQAGAGVALAVLPRLENGSALSAAAPARATFTVLCAIGGANG